MLRGLGVQDPSGRRAEELSAVKQGVLMQLVEAGSFVVFDDALRFLCACLDRGLRICAASSSKNANEMMARVHVPQQASLLVDLFHANVCGRDLRHGKPHPEIFLTAADALRVPVERCVVVEDAPSGVQAAKAAGMSCIGVARVGDEQLLNDAGADWVVRDLDEVELSRILNAGRVS